MKRNLIWSASVLGGLIMAGMSLTAQAATVNFGCITNNDSSGQSCAVVAAQLSATVSDIGGGQVMFWITNSGAAASSITDIYFDDNDNHRYLASISGLIDADEGVGGSSGVDFSLGASPKELPGANNASPAFVTSSGLSADSDAPVSHNGINPGEYLGISFFLGGGVSFADVLSGLTSGALRMGLHVQSFNGGYSESAVSNPLTPTVVPIPAAAWLFGSGLMGVLAVGRRRSV